METHYQDANGNVKPISSLPWWRKDKDGWPVVTWQGRPFASFLRVVCQNIRKVTG